MNRRPPSDYISTILSSNSWGGAIELSIFARHYETEIWSIDVKTGRIDRFGEGSGFLNFTLVVYSGIRELCSIPTLTMPVIDQV